MKYTKGQINTLRQRLDLWCILMYGAGANRDLTDSQVVDNYERLGLNKNDEVIEETPDIRANTRQPIGFWRRIKTALFD
mgnify:CR=1 FL=1|tara:strand:+ start:1398 stop:1634 length:237 start_codon:yes stop_codon:yes gene_type:complete